MNIEVHDIFTCDDKPFLLGRYNTQNRITIVNNGYSRKAVLNNLLNEKIGTSTTLVVRQIKKLTYVSTFSVVSKVITGGIAFQSVNLKIIV